MKGERKLCRGQVCYSYRDAHEVINSIKRRQHFVHSKHIPKRCYPCDKCGYYHLTKKNEGDYS